MPLAYAPDDEAKAAFAKLRTYAEAAGRDPASIGIDTRVSVGIGAEAEWRDTVRFWKDCGVTHLTLGDVFRARSFAAHRRPLARGPSRRDQALLGRGRRSAVADANLGPRPNCWTSQQFGRLVLLRLLLP